MNIHLPCQYAAAVLEQEETLFYETSRAARSAGLIKALAVTNSSFNSLPHPASCQQPENNLKNKKKKKKKEIPYKKKHDLPSSNKVCLSRSTVREVIGRIYRHGRRISASFDSPVVAVDLFTRLDTLDKDAKTKEQDNHTEPHHYESAFLPPRPAV